MTPRFEGKVALVTGASRGIGFATAAALVDEGAQVVITGRNFEALEDAVKALGGNSKAIGCAGSADNHEHQHFTVKTALEEFGRLDYLVNCAGINPKLSPLVDLDPATSRRILDVNCLAPLAWTQAAYHAWMGAHGGAVVNLCSVAGVRASPGIGFYGASKAFLAQLTEQLSLELAPRVRVNAVAPAVVKTDFSSALYEGKEDAVSDAYPMKRLGTAEEVAEAIAYFLSPSAGWITGQVMVLDGGLTLTRKS